MLPAASKNDKKKTPAKIIQLGTREESLKLLPVSKPVTPSEAKDSRSDEENPFENWVMPPQPTSFEKGPDYDFF
jgi:hypothetical protein